jgi:site-specific recombinase XerC
VVLKQRREFNVVFYLANQELYIPRAKGGFDFTKGLTSKAVNIIQKYLQARPKTESLNLFVLENGKPLTRETLIQRFRRVTKKLGLDTGFHAFRRRYISRHLQDGKSLVDVSLAVNHRSPRMTEQYLIPDVQKSIKEQKQW